MVQRDGPRAAQPLAHRRVDRLQRIVPVAVPVGRELRARDDARRDDRERPLDVLPHGRALGLIVAVRHGRTARPRRGSRRRRRRAGTGPARAPARRRCRRASRRPDVALAIEEHEPLRPVAVGVLVAKTRSSRSRSGSQRPSASSSSTGPWHTSRVPQPPPGVLLEPARREVVDQRVVGEPGQDVLQPRHVGGERTAAGGRSATGPVMLVQNRVVRRLVALPAASDDRATPGDAETDAPAPGPSRTQERLPAGSAVGEQHLVSAHRSMVVPAAASMRKPPSGKRRPTSESGSARTTRPVPSRIDSGPAPPRRRRRR